MQQNALSNQQTCQEEQLAEQVLAGGLALDALWRHALRVQHEGAVPASNMNI